MRQKSLPEFFNLCAHVCVPALLAGMLVACAPTVNTQGQILLPSRLAQLQPGVSTKDDVVALLGTPSMRGTMNDARWYYVTATTESRPLRGTEVLSRKVLVLDFDVSNTLVAVDEKTQADGRALAPSDKVTRTEGQSLGVLDQVLETVTTPFKR